MPKEHKAKGVELERVLADALRHVDPAQALRAARADTNLGEETQAALASIDPDGLVIAGLLVVRLRFERLLQGSALAGRWFAEDPASFAAAFKRYHTTVAPRWIMPAEEAAAFERWHLESETPETA